jgi:hypothetical protein
MDGKIKRVENPSRNSECMHVKWKFVVTVLWNNYVGINFTSTIWWPSCGDFFLITVRSKFFYNFCHYTIDERVQMSDFVF